MTAPSRADVLARLNAARKATPGPWRAVEGDLEGKPPSEYVATLLGNREADGTTTGRLFLTLAANPIDPELGAEVVPATTGDGPQSEANAEHIALNDPEFVASAMQALLSLTDVVEQARALVAERREWDESDADSIVANSARAYNHALAKVARVLDAAPAQAPRPTRDEIAREIAEHRLTASGRCACGYDLHGNHPWLPCWEYHLADVLARRLDGGATP